MNRSPGHERAAGPRPESLDDQQINRLNTFSEVLLESSNLIEALSARRLRSGDLNRFTFPLFKNAELVVPEIFKAHADNLETATLILHGSVETGDAYVSIELDAGDVTLIATRTNGRESDLEAKRDASLDVHDIADAEQTDYILDTAKHTDETYQGVDAQKPEPRTLGENMAMKVQAAKTVREQIILQTDEELASRFVPIPQLSKQEFNSLLMSLVQPSTSGDYSQLGEVDLIDATIIDTMRDGLHSSLELIEERATHHYAFTDELTTMSFTKKAGEVESFELYYINPKNGALHSMQYDDQNQGSLSTSLRFYTFPDIDDVFGNTDGSLDKLAQRESAIQQQAAKRDFSPTNEELQHIQSIIVREHEAAIQRTTGVIVDAVSVDPIEIFDESKVAEGMMSPSGQIDRLLEEAVAIEELNKNGFDTPDAGTA